MLASGCHGAGRSGTATPAAAGTPTSAAAAAAHSVPGSAAAASAAPSAAAPAAAAQQVGSVSTVGALAGVGVATVANETSSTPQAPVSGPTVFTLTAWQATNLQEGVNGRQGITGSDLNTMLPMPAGTPRLDDIIGGWVIGRGDPASVAAGSLLGDQGWAYPDQVVFPTAVLTLFMADYLQHASSASVSASSAQPAVRRGAVSACRWRVSIWRTRRARRSRASSTWCWTRCSRCSRSTRPTWRTT